MKETELEQSLQLASTRFRVQVILGDIKFWDGTLHLAGTGLIATTIIVAHFGSISCRIRLFTTMYTASLQKCNTCEFLKYGRPTPEVTVMCVPI